MKAAVLVFPGSNRERDMVMALTRAMGKAPTIVWHRETELPKTDLIVIPGGFAYGDYLRTGAMAAQSPIMRAVAERALTRQGYTVMTAENGEAALELLDRNGRPDLLISDVVMPTMDGPTMVRHARDRYPDLPIIFMSGYAEEQLRKSIDLDNVAFLPKPFSVQQLAEAARDVLTTR